MKIAISYAIFALLAIMANIGSQDVSLAIYDGRYSLASSVLFGTAVGLVVKFVLDKRYIFRHKVEGLRQEARIFYLYSIVGAATTLIFWTFEFGFDRVFNSTGNSTEMRYIGGSLGLCIGYCVKYRLDKKFVFNQSHA